MTDETRGVAMPTVTDDVLPIYLNRDCTIWCVVYPVDYEWASKWKWKPVWSRGSSRKCYAVRSARVGGRGSRNICIFMHKQICLRAKGVPPTKDHIVGDHGNGNSLDNRRDNLSWATVEMNNRNRHGYFAQQVRLALLTNDATRLDIGERKRVKA